MTSFFILLRTCFYNDGSERCGVNQSTDGRKRVAIGYFGAVFTPQRTIGVYAE